MDEDLDAVEPDREQMMRLDQFEALVHHRCRIDTDLCPHRPVGMRDRLRGAHALHIGGFHGAERGAAGGQDDAALLVEAPARKALEYRIMLAVDRQDRRARRSEDTTSELQSLMRISYAVFRSKKINKY